ncbi:heme ABC transporter ATP-binding protein [Nocardia vermiculata]|uniref:Heme ABC transporter ATP-binding protein n=1 Tax=Nocardia vermiculata TaxID=257274 RepID=A0A846Y3H8_9NOCA|nr:heme ABC transporter ATP-binding protein [Nocardia vermiculata]NKY51828.1 heme ABC transporter ATP-binding protein [Nocardia vermiculata]
MNRPTPPLQQAPSEGPAPAATPPTRVVAPLRAWVRRLRPAHGVPAGTEPGAVTLRARGVSAQRGGRTVLDAVDIDVVAGEILALVGPNGAGKSTLLAALSGELEPTGGAVELDGRALTHWTPTDMARRRAVLPQNHTVGFPFTVREVVAMGRSPWARTPRQDDDERAIAAALAATDIEYLAGRPFPALSGGERARAALARVLAQDTETLLLDEPTAALDLGHQEQVLTLAADRARAGAAVVVVLHDLGLAAAYADRVAVLEAGRLAAVGAPREILTTELLSAVYRHPVEVVDHPVTGAQLILPVRR